ncbi:MAG TPA: sigma-70 family RNA polymerase sigma factor [Thermoanaerobaculia bacterium]|nr:sigma-70 family RNA polymerase sigma factor [Thermoanaerobaculia bacterium]
MEPATQHDGDAGPVGSPVLVACGAGMRSFDDIYDRHVPLLRYIAMTRYRIPRPDADGLIHDIFLTFLSNPSQVREVRPYLIGAICRASQSYWRRRRADDALFAPPAEGEPMDERCLDEVSVRLTVAATMARLSPRCRETLRRYYLDGESTAFIAGVMETSSAYILKVLHLCRKKAQHICRSVERVP